METRKFSFTPIEILALIFFLGTASLFFLFLREDIEWVPIVTILWFLLGCLALPLLKDFYQASVSQSGSGGFLDIFSSSIPQYLFFLSVLLFIANLIVVFLLSLFNLLWINEFVLLGILLILIVGAVYFKNKNIFSVGVVLFFAVSLTCFYFIINNFVFLFPQIEVIAGIGENLQISSLIFGFFLFLTTLILTPTVFLKHMKDNEETVELVSSFSTIFILLVTPLVVFLGSVIISFEGKSIFTEDHFRLVLLFAFFCFAFVVFFVFHSILKILQTKNLFFKSKIFFYNQNILFLALGFFLFLLFLIAIHFTNSILAFINFSSVFVILSSLISILFFRKKHPDIFNIYTFKFINFYYIVLIIGITIYLFYLLIFYSKNLIFFGVFIIFLSLIYIIIKYINDEFFRVRLENFAFYLLFPLSYFYLAKYKNSLKIENSNKILLIGFPVLFYIKSLLKQCRKETKIYIVCYSKIEKILLEKIYLKNGTSKNVRLICIKDRIVDFKLPKVDSVICVNLISRLKSKSFFISYINSLLKLNSCLYLIEIMPLPFYKNCETTVKEKIKESGFEMKFYLQKGLLFNYSMGKGYKKTSIYYTNTWKEM